MGTKYNGSEQDQLTLDTFIKLMRASDSINNRLFRHLQENDLTLSQFGTLEALYHLGPLNQRSIGEKLLKSGGNITMVVDNLEKNGLVVREKDPSDRRAMLVRLTSSGKTFIQSFFPRHLEKIRAEFAVLSDEEKRQLGAVCKKLGVR